MNYFGLIPIVVLALFLPAALQAGTFENTDPDPYKYEVTIDGVPSSGTIYGCATRAQDASG